MNNAATGSGRTYGNVYASDNTRVIVGDNHEHINTRFESVTFNLYCSSLSNIAALPHHITRPHDGTSPTSTHDSTSTLDGNTMPSWTSADRQGCRYPEHDFSEAESQNMRNDRNSTNSKIIRLHEALEGTIAALITSEQERSRHEALTSKSGTAREPVNKSTSDFYIAQNKSAHQNPKGISVHGNDGHPRTSTASLQASAYVHEISMTFKDDLTKPCTFAREDSQYRIFFLRKEGPDWTQSTCSESFMSPSQIKDRIKRGPMKSRLKKQNVKWTLEKLEPRRRYTSEHLLQEVNRCDPHGHEWTIAAIDNENPKLTKSSGEVAMFSVILVKASADLVAS